jgi:hypothetical protein
LLTVGSAASEPIPDATGSRAKTHRLVIAATCAALVLSTALTAIPFWDQLGAYRARYGAMTASERERAAGTQNAFDAASWDAIRARLRSGDRYALIGQPETSHDAAVENLVARTYASYWLLPAVQVRSPQNADVLVYFKPSKPPVGAECFASDRPVCIRRVR